MECVAGISSVIAGSSREHHVAPAARTPIVAFKARKLPMAPSFRDTPFFVLESKCLPECEINPALPELRVFAIFDC